MPRIADGCSDTTCTRAAAFFSAFIGTVNSTCSNPSAAIAATRTFLRDFVVMTNLRAQSVQIARAQEDDGKPPAAGPGPVRGFFAARCLRDERGEGYAELRT